jgi:HK97 family phage prohead protease
MKVEIRADGKAQISGYVNVTEKKSRPVVTPHGKVIEEIEPRAFEQAIERAGNITVTVDHDNANIYASTQDGTLTLYEDAIGLHADVVINDPAVIEIAKQGKIRGWSFGMYNVVDTLEPRANDIPIRHITALDLDHVALVVNKRPVYAATSIEVRAGADIDIETRAFFDEPKVIDNVPTTPAATQNPDNTAYHNRIAALRQK